MIYTNFYLVVKFKYMMKKHFDWLILENSYLESFKKHGTIIGCNALS